MEEIEPEELSKNKRSLVFRYIFTGLILVASGYDIFAACFFGAEKYYWSLLCSIPMAVGGIAVLLFTILTRKQDRNKVRPLLSLIVSLLGVVFWTLYVFSYLRIDGESGIIAFSISWPVLAFFGIGAILILLETILHKATGNRFPVLYYFGMVLTFVAFLLFAFFLTSESYFIFGGIVFALAGVAYFIEELP
ncbi:MAG: hypothetical protein PUA93_02740 [Eubacteriales bacterium]|nr:hypothetical protein [Eubacteriales bacterium]